MTTCAVGVRGALRSEPLLADPGTTHLRASSAPPRDLEGAGLPPRAPPLPPGWAEAFPRGGRSDGRTDSSLLLVDSGQLGRGDGFPQVTEPQAGLGVAPLPTSVRPGLLLPLRPRPGTGQGPDFCLRLFGNYKPVKRVCHLSQGSSVAAIVSSCVGGTGYAHSRLPRSNYCNALSTTAFRNAA